MTGFEAGSDAPWNAAQGADPANTKGAGLEMIRILWLLAWSILVGVAFGIADGLPQGFRTRDGIWLRDGASVRRLTDVASHGGTIPLADAMPAFQIALNLCAADPCESRRADVVVDGSISAGDAPCIHQHAMGAPGCLD